MKDLRIEYRLPTVEEYQELRTTTDWGEIANVIVEQALPNSLFGLCIVQQEQTIGCGRIVGDGYMYFYIQDVIVQPQHRGKGYGKIILNELLRYLHKNAPKQAFVGLMAAKGTQEFYEKLGFQCRPENGPGMFLKDLSPEA